ncbi:cache domain-containing protein, partial [Pseudoalteromonas sp. S983]
MLSGITLRIKIILFTAAIFVSLLVVAVFGLQALRHASESDNIARINQLMKSTVNIVEQFEHYVVTGELDEAQAKKLATKMLRENKYHDSEYVYVVNEKLD